MKNELLKLITKAEQPLVQGLSIKKGSTVYMEGEKCTKIGIVLKGRIDIESYSFSGNELIYNSLTENGVFGNNLIFSNNPIYKGNVVAKEDSIVAFIEKDNLIKILQENQRFLIGYLNVTSEFSKKLNSTIKMLSYDNAEERFLYYLYINGGTVEFKTVTDLANILHLQRETLSRLLTKLENQKYIKRVDKKIVYLK